MATDLTNLAVLHHEAGDLAEAKRFYRQAITFWDNVADLDNPETARALEDCQAMLRQLQLDERDGADDLTRLP